MNDGASSEHDLRKAVTTFEDIYKISHRVFGADHPTSRDIQDAPEESDVARVALLAPVLGLLEVVVIFTGATRRTYIAVLALVGFCTLGAGALLERALKNPSR